MYSAEWFSVATTERFTVYQKELSLPFFCPKSLVSIKKKLYQEKEGGVWGGGLGSGLYSLSVAASSTVFHMYAFTVIARCALRDLE